MLGTDPARAGRAVPRPDRHRVAVVRRRDRADRARGDRARTASPYRRRRPVAEVIGLVGLDDKADARIDTLSGGQQRRLDLALGIVGHPEVLFLDEPTTGFDAAARRKSWELIAELCRLGTTVLLTTHYLDEAEHARRPRRRAVARRARGRGHARRADRRPRRHGRVVQLVGRRSGRHGRRCCRAIAIVQRRSGSSSPPPIRRVDVHAVTGWAIEHGVRLDALSVAAPDARGRVPRPRRRAERRASEPCAVTDAAAGRRPSALVAAPDPRPAADVLAHADRAVLHDPAAARHARAVQRLVRRRHGRDRRRASGRSTSSTPAGWRRSPPSAPRTPTSPTWCRSGARRACSSGGAARRCRPAAYLAGFVGSAFVLAVVGAGDHAQRSESLAYDLEIEAAKVPAMIVTFLVGVCTLLGARVWRSPALVPNARSAAAVANATILPLGVRLQRLHPDRGSAAVAGDARQHLPAEAVRGRASRTRSTRSSPAPAFNWGKLAYVALWGVAGAIVAVKYFRWESAPGDASTPPAPVARQASA